MALFRAYDPDLGRWINRDPLGEAGGLNLYAYCSGNPVNLVDPEGGAPSDWADWIDEKISVAEDFYTSGNNWVWDGSVATGAELLAGVADALRFGQASGAVAGDPCADAGDWAGAAFTDTLRGVSLAGGSGASLLKKLGKATKIKPGSFSDKPPGWNENWEWHSSPRAKPGSDGWRWRDGQGGEWRRHVPDKHHPEAHWDYNPNNQWNSPWHNVDNNGNLMLFSSP